ncbi:MAG TPA: glycosyltransferase family 2 protein, partial [Thermoanaerobaculia bacterium]|nr:glycosyltransferase family 2 protein [Thermoanaerobaculia bacterium]
GGSYTTDGLIDGQECIGFIGCGAIIRKTVIDEVGGFADWMFLYTHEFEYALRCVDRGFRIRYFARCVVRHRASPLHRVTRRVVTHSVRNELLIVSKYFGKQRRTYLVRTFVHHLLRHRRDGVSALLNVFEGLWMYLRNPVRKLRTPVRAETQDRYTATFSTTQPLWPLLGRSLKRRLGVRGARVGPS